MRRTGFLSIELPLQDWNGITANDGSNIVTVTGGVSAVNVK
jgi:hypothetical protein